MYAGTHRRKVGTFFTESKKGHPSSAGTSSSLEQQNFLASGSVADPDPNPDHPDLDHPDPDHPDPDPPDPHVFGPPGSTSQRYGSGSGS